MNHPRVSFINQTLLNSLYPCTFFTERCKISYVNSTGTLQHWTNRFKKLCTQALKKQFIVCCLILMFALQCIGSLGNLLPLAECIHSSADEMLIWGPEMNVFDTSPYLVNTVFLNEPFVSLSIYPKPREAFILRSSLDLFILFMWDEICCPWM